jgi:hypothetical protein
MDIKNINKWKYKRFENTLKIKVLEQNGNWSTNEFDTNMILFNKGVMDIIIGTIT